MNVMSFLYPDTDTLRKMPYTEYLQTDHWRNVREKVFEKYGKKCVICGRTDSIECHHKTYANRGCSMEHLDVVPLCRDCHELVEIIKRNHAVCLGKYYFQCLNQARKDRKIDPMVPFVEKFTKALSCIIVRLNQALGDSFQTRNMSTIISIIKDALRCEYESHAGDNCFGYINIPIEPSGFNLAHEVKIARKEAKLI